jgi:hypothetical protein
MPARRSTQRRRVLRPLSEHDVHRSQALLQLLVVRATGRGDVQAGQGANQRIRGEAHKQPLAAFRQARPGVLADQLGEASRVRAERDQRPVKNPVKISGCHQSETDAATWLALRSCVSSATKHGVSAFEALRPAMTGTPWTPPLALED